MRRRSLLALVVAVAVLALPASAGAQVTVGQLGAVGQIKECGPADGRDYAQRTVVGGAGYVAPSAGLLTSWSTRSLKTGSLGLKVYRPFAGGYLVLAADGPKDLPAGIPSTFAVSIPVQAGDLVGVEVPPFGGSGCVFETAFASDVVDYRLNRVPVGGTLAFDKNETSRRLNISATLLPPPQVTSIAPAQGSIKGGSVTIAGANFAAVSAVTFGGVPATSFTVDSEAQITASAPAVKVPGSVAVTVTTAAGVASGPQAYSYLACTVPKLKGKKLKGAKKAIRRAGCKVGKVSKRKGATAKTGKVSGQNPKPGAVVLTGALVKVTLKP